MQNIGHSQSKVATPGNDSPDSQSVTANVEVQEPQNFKIIKVTVKSEKNVTTLPNESVSVIYT